MWDPDFDVPTHGEAFFLPIEDKARLMVHDKDRLLHDALKLSRQAFAMDCLVNAKAKDQKDVKESFMIPSASIVEKESLKGDCNTRYFSFQLYNAHSFSQKSQKQHFVMFLPSLGNKQQKVNENDFEKGPTLFFQKFYKNKRS